jgi:hypothetical protein
VLAQNKKELLTNWWNEGKLEASEDLGDMVSAAGVPLRWLNVNIQAAFALHTGLPEGQGSHVAALCKPSFCAGEGFGFALLISDADKQMAANRT